MKFTERQQQILFAKLKPWNDYKQCVGYLLPTEILYLCSLGCKPEQRYKIDEAARQVKVGEIYGTWFYFSPTKEVLARVRERNPSWKNHG